MTSKDLLEAGLEGVCTASQLRYCECDHSCGLVIIAAVWFGKPQVDIEPQPAVEPEKL